MRATRVGAATAAVLALCTALTVPASAEDPRDRKREVDRRAEAVETELHEHSQEVAAAVRKLRDAEDRLPAARKALAKAEEALGEAKAEDAAAAARLEVARAKEEKSVRALAELRGRLDETHDLMGSIARESYKRGGSVGELALVLEAESPDDLADRVSAVDSVLQAQEDAVRTLADARAQTASRRATLEALREQVAELRREAAERLERTQEAERRAAAAEQEVSRLVSQREQALAAAEKAKAEDERRYRQLQKESERLGRVLAARAAAARERARERAAARAESSGSSSSGSSGSSGGSGSGGSGGSGSGGSGSGSAAASSSSGLLSPVSGPITSAYGMRVHPITGEYKLHDGTDFGVGCGVPVRAAASGTVVHAVGLTGYGNQVAIDHGTVRGAGLATSYNHLSGFAVSSGQRVSRGQVVGYIGSTGYSTGCHLHFMVYENGSTTDPMRYL